MKWPMETTNFDFLQANLPAFSFKPAPLDDRLQAAATAAERTGTVGPLVREELKTRIQKRRLEEGLPEIHIHHSPPRQYKMSPHEVEKRERRKAQNRKAAKKCREKKKEQQGSVHTTHEKEKTKHEQLKKQVCGLKQHLSNLQHVLLTHLTMCSLRIPDSSDDQQRQQQQQQQGPNYQYHHHQEQQQLVATPTSEAPLTSTDIAALFPELISNNLFLESVSAIDDLKDLKTTDLPNFTGQVVIEQGTGGPGEMWQAGNQSMFTPVATVTPANVNIWQSEQQPSFTLTQHVTPTSASTSTTSDVDHNDLPGYPFSHRRRQNTSQGCGQPAASSTADVPIPTTPKSAPPDVPKSVSPNLKAPQRGPAFPQSAQFTTAQVRQPFDFGNWQSHRPNTAATAQPQVQKSATPPSPYSFFTAGPSHFQKSTAASPPAPPSPLVPQQVVPGTADTTPSTSPAPFFDDQLRYRFDSCITAIPEQECYSSTLPDLAFEDYMMSSQED